eukprot:157646-Chlamydomonas_euryale.AAC.3
MAGLPPLRPPSPPRLPATFSVPLLTERLGARHHLRRVAMIGAREYGDGSGSEPLRVKFP